MLTIDRLRFAYEGQPEPWTFDLEVAPGEITAITGESGVGKSTLLDLIAGFLAPASGRILIGGEDISPSPPEHRPVSILFQDENLFDHLTIAANVGLGLPKTTPADERNKRISAALAEMGMQDYETRRAARLSGGQKQRVALARTLLRDRPVLLLDEPFAALDAVTATTIRKYVREMVRAHGWHTLIVSHLPEDAESFADRQLSIENYRLKSD